MNPLTLFLVIAAAVACGIALAPFVGTIAAVLAALARGGIALAIGLTISRACSEKASRCSPACPTECVSTFAPYLERGRSCSRLRHRTNVGSFVEGSMAWLFFLSASYGQLSLSGSRSYSCSLLMHAPNPSLLPTAYCRG